MSEFGMAADEDTNQRLEHLINRFAPSLTKAAHEEVARYYRRDEPEMAFEGLLIELLTANAALSKVDFCEIEELASAYGLDDEGGVFQFDILRKVRSKLGRLVSIKDAQFKT